MPNDPFHRNLGLLPGGGGTQRLPRIVGIGRVKALLFSGDPIDVKEAFRIGLVNAAVPNGSLMDNAKKMARTLAARPGYTLQAIIGVVNEGIQLTILRLTVSWKVRYQCYASSYVTAEYREYASFLKDLKALISGFTRNRLKCNLLRVHQNPIACAKAVNRQF